MVIAKPTGGIVQSSVSEAVKTQQTMKMVTGVNHMKRDRRYGTKENVNIVLLLQTLVSVEIFLYVFRDYQLSNYGGFIRILYLSR